MEEPMGFDEKEYHAVILGALLHDIGKFVQRVQINPTSQNHSHWGDEWFQNNLAEKLTSVFGENEKQIIRSAISNHHEHEKYISLADAISAGMDRVAIKAINLDDEEKGDPFTDRLISIFSQVSISEKPKSEKYNKFVQLGKDRLNEIFPIDEKKCSLKEYSELLESFEKEIKASDFDSLTPEKLIELIYFLLWKYCWCIPSATYKIEPDVPLFDHLKTTAAIAGCLYAYREENPGETLSIESKALCLIGGDISGIQSYIFDVLTQQGKVAKRLRARSLFVQLVSEVASHKILHAFHLPLCNLILSAGGNFYILAPNLEDVPKVVGNLQKEFDEWTLKEINAELSVSLAIERLSGKGLADFSKALEGLKTELSYRKHQPHKSALSDKGKWTVQEFIRPEVVEGDEKACQGCHKFPIKEPAQVGDSLCERCSNDSRIGQLLPKTKYLAFFNDNLHGFEVLNYSFELWDDVILSKVTKDRPYLILALNNPEIKLPVLGFKYFANHIPITSDIPSDKVEEGEPVTFNDIADSSKGDKLIGYVKADVDNMGLILRDGFKDTKLSISRFATFSRLLETFFAGYLQVKMKSDFKELYTIFSGGDDFFVLGPWDKSIEFANIIRKDLSLFCANNPDLTFSAGIFLTKPHEPISYCAEVVEEKLRNSKRKEGKDKITLFDQTVDWDELEKILTEAKKIIKWLKEEIPIVSRGFIHKLRKYGEMAQESRICEAPAEVKTEFLKFIPLLVYDIKRNLTREGQRIALDWAEDLIPSIDKPHGGQNLEFLRTIMDYVLTYTRS
jgi:CRISPR-associated protein Csm1